jgi:hypothetical protein
MHKSFSSIFGAILVASAAVPAQAASTIVVGPISTALNPTLAVFNNFTTVTGGTPTGQTARKTSPSITGFDGAYLLVKGLNTGNSGSFEQTLSTPAQAFSFLFSGLPATGASLKLNFVGGTSETVNLYTAAGNQTSGRLTFHRNGGTNPSITSVVFGALNSNVAYSIDSLASAAPEPGTWGLLIVGFGMAGAALRRRSGAQAEA